MNEYKLDFTKLTIGDVRPVLTANPSVGAWLTMTDKIVLGGIMHRPVTEIRPIMELVTVEFAAWLASAEFMRWVAK